MERAADLEVLLRVVRERGASDLHLCAGAAPQLRIDGELVALANASALECEDVRRLCEPVLDVRQRRALEDAGEIAVAFETATAGRFRVSVFRRVGGLGAVFRAIPAQPPELATLGLPTLVEALCERRRGLLLVTGPSGSGRSTTLAAMIQRITADRRRHVVTVEDPVEHLYARDSGLVSQRQIGTDTRSVGSAVQAALRQDPDVVVIGELGDMGAAEAALNAAEAGPLCLAAARGGSVTQALARLIDLFPAPRQTQARAQLAQALEGMLNQRLVPCAAGGGRLLAIELLIPGPAARTLIREDNLAALYAHLQNGPAGGAGGAAQTMNRCLADLYLARRITLEAALGHSADPTELQQLIAGPAARRTG